MSAPTPLAGIKVVEFTHMVMGPTVGHILAGLGAEVVRVEPIGGDQTRRLLGSGAGYFPMYNRGKQSICLDLKSTDGLAVAKDLCAQADVLVENFRPGALDRLGLDYSSLAKSNPRLIYCSEKGFLPGPYEQRTALDEVAQMMGGLAYMTGPPGRPLRAGASVIDVTGGMFGVIGILAALEERHRTGRGQKVVASLFETTAYLVGQHMAQFAVTGKPAAPMPARVSAWAIYDVFETKDDPVFIGVVTDALWQKFCALFGLDDLWADESIRANNQRVLARERILPRIRDLVGQMTRAEVIAKLDGTGMPFAPIGKPEELFDDPHLNAGGMEPVRLDTGAETKLPTIPLEMDGKRPGAPSALPKPGADARAVLESLGYPAERIATLIETGAVEESQ
ncbi:CaiB/BaiF CoA-transferase family protein [Novosphingobium sp.]|jgi:crotonobetainyl-CoA:carnitine CoA-transferase CaiB-like acyl-CoA transferase|uniref:CaiB/BaiF CoA transferase family protein n=1 Tax=Novosphingobium sp. TaxID=1874826 RepID=UPI0022BB59A4|nr:CaiB/BaiF CoA-transferase family protein [Novosphingobium sp.]MCZ8019456.1 CaiB/BaiF CoA-transferase family protein [Novosphingobium sp.]MCZ8035271.1 CaiB/BaiF CoA-transferase family protein [Novosphingobium sp.]MCZ8050585.1 CaiB/BaiF CoA-transferase family protein [Novosphingobium sp.]MCZ8058931.1 CaiB/BaiF CoA-transferase family protein [Novosphingobium sp.]MCZ8232376.1 CaiB/BaiF CoA-transferase family protein [Novosphingobium sp.]